MSGYMHLNNALSPLREEPEGKTVVPQITAYPSKGQYSNPLKYSDVPAQTKKRYRKLSTEDLGRLVERSGGATSPKGRVYAAVLEERSVNPMLAGKNPVLAKSSPYSVYKTAQYHSVVAHLNKVANMGTAYVNPDKRYGQKLPNETNVDSRIGGMSGGIAGGLLAGGAVGALGGKGIMGRAMTGAAGAALGATAGGIYGAVKKPVKNINEV